MDKGIRDEIALRLEKSKNKVTAAKRLLEEVFY